MGRFVFDRPVGCEYAGEILRWNMRQLPHVRVESVGPESAGHARARHEHDDVGAPLDLSPFARHR